MTSSPYTFLLRYVLASSVLFTAWSGIGDDYTRCIIPAVNVLTETTDIPMAMERHRQHLLYRYMTPVSSFRMAAHDYGAIYLNLVPFLALIAATPGRRPSWYAISAGAGCLTLWSTHVVSFCLGGIMALQPLAAASPVAATVLAALFPGAGELAGVVLEQWAMWGQYGICLVLWGLCVSMPLRMPQPAPLALWLPWRMRPVTR